MATKKTSKKTTKKTQKRVSDLDAKIGVAALYIRGLQLHRSDAGILIVEYIDYLLLTDKVENPNRDIKNWIQVYNENSLRRKRLKDDIIHFICTHHNLYHVSKIMDTLFGKDNWTIPQCITE